MANDPGLAADTCIFMEAIPGDGGNQNPNDVWWLSPDITLTGHISGPENADAGTNQIAIRFHRKPAGTCNFPGDESITVQAWVANPSLVMAPHIRGSAARVGFIGSPLPAEGGSNTQLIDWTLPPAPVPSPIGVENPQEPGPKCLVAICYPESLTPNANRFFVPGDRHLAQHNLCLLSTTGAQVRFKLNTLNPSIGTAAVVPLVKLRAVMDLAPSTFVQKTVLKRLQLLPGFQQLRTTPLAGGFGFDLTGLQASQVVDHSHAGAGISPTPPIPSFEAMVQLGTTLKQITFAAGLREARQGDACIYHLTQTFKDVAQGGLTLVLLKL